jgi:transposase
MKKVQETKQEETVERIDTKKLSREVREQMRRECVRMRKKGISRAEVADILGLNPSTVSQWWQAYQREGARSFKLGIPGKRKGQGRKLSPEQEKRIQELLIDKTPDELKFPFALWERKGVKLLIEREFGIEISIRAVGDYLHRWGFTPQKPLKRAYEQSDARVRHWLKESYPAIERRAQEEGAEIHWGDETGLRNTSQYGRSYAPKGQTPVQTLPAKRISTNFIATVSNQGKVRFMGYHGKMNAQLFLKFLRRLIQGNKKKIFLILDNLRVHHATPVQAWLEEHSEQIELFFLPSYSPELNPTEYLNGDLKRGVHAKPPVRTQKELAQYARSHLRMLQRNPQRVINYFRHPKIAYAADKSLQQACA